MKNNKIEYFVVNTAVANIYAEPNFRSEIVTQALLGESCQIMTKEDNWYNVKQWDDYTGWVHSFFGVFAEEPYRASSVMLENTGEIVDLDSNQIIRSMVFGNRLECQKNSNYISVVLPDGMKGKTNALIGKITDSPRRCDIVKIARQFLGITYMWGGKTTYGFDCSGYVQTIFNSVGIDLPRDASDQVKFLETHTIEFSEILPGDLLFFKVGNAVDHVAIFIGNNEYIHSRGFVRISSFNSQNDEYIEILDKHLHQCCSIELWVEA
jgi:hypothetical protein